MHTCSSKINESPDTKLIDNHGCILFRGSRDTRSSKYHASAHLSSAKMTRKGISERGRPSANISAYFFFHFGREKKRMIEERIELAHQKERKRGKERKREREKKRTENLERILHSFVRAQNNSEYCN